MLISLEEAKRMYLVLLGFERAWILICVFYIGDER
jgi:hypothetical protein